MGRHTQTARLPLHSLGDNTLKLFTVLTVTVTFGTLALACGRPSSMSQVKVAAAFSTTFTGKCANCHGAAGEGDTGPSLKAVDYATFSTKVRTGGRGMPKFATDVYPDSDVKSDFTALTGKAAQ